MRRFQLLAIIIAIIAAGLGDSPSASATSADLNAQVDCGATGIGTSSHDDTIALQHCINLAAAGGQAVFIPSGTYYISSPLSISTDSVTIFGSNQATTTILQSNASADTIDIANGGAIVNKVTIRSLELVYSTQNPTGITIYCNNCWRALFRDLSVGKTVTTGGTPHWFANGIWAVGGSFIYVEDSRFTNTSSNGLVFQNVNEVNLMNLQVNNYTGDTNVTGLVFDGSTGAIYATNVNVTAGGTGFLFENTFGGSGDANFPVYGFFTHCLADSQSGTGWYFNAAKSMRLTNSWAATAGGSGIVIGNANTISITDSRIINNGAIGIQIESPASQISVKDSMIAGNARLQSGDSGIDVAPGVSNFQFLNNQIGAAGDFTATQAFGITIETGASDNYIIVGNNLQNNVTGGIINGATGTHYVNANNLD